MASKVPKVGNFGGMHTAGIFSDMTVDGPDIGTLVVIMDRAKNLPNRRSMGKQDPYCAARLGKEAKKTTTDRRGGQTPRWDQELRFTVHDSPDYHQLKVSVFNDDKKTELIGETWVSLESILLPGGGQSDGWHGLNCKGKYAGEVRIELTYYDTRPKVEKPVVEKKAASSRPETGSPAIGGPRENTPVKRRPLPSDPTGASPSPAGTPDPRGLSGPQSGPRGYGTPPLPRTAHHSDAPPHRRPLPHASPLNGTPVSNHQSPQYQRGSHPEHDGRSPSPIPPLSNTPLYNDDGFDMSYTAPKPYEVPSGDSMPQHVRAMSQDNFRHSHGHSQAHIELPHSHSAPIVPTQHSDPYSNGYGQHPDSYAQDPYEEPPYHVEPLRMSRNSDRGYDQGAPHDPYQASNPYADASHGYIDHSHDPFISHGRSPGSMQPTVEDEDEVPPPPPVHRSGATSVVPQQPNHVPSYHSDTPAPLNINRYREDPQRAGYDYDSPPQGYGMNDYSTPPSQERRYTHPHPVSRPVSRDTMAPSPLRNETAVIPSSLVPGFDGSRQDNRMSQAIQSYETPPRPRQHSEPDYRAPQHYETPPHQLPHHQSFPSASSPNYYPHDAPEQPRRTSPVHETALVRPRAISPGAAHNIPDNRASRAPARSMPTRKSVSPRPPPSTADDGERRLSGVPFNPDSFDVYNPTVTKKSPSGTPGKSDDAGDKVEINERGQVVTFSGRVIDASDHLPLDSWAPEPETKGPKKDRPARERPVLSGARDLEAARERERSYRQQRLERERIRNAVYTVASDDGSPGNSLVSSRHQFGSANGSPMSGGGAMVLHDHESTPPGSGGRNRLQKRNPRPMSSYTPPSNASPGHVPLPNSNVLRERENIGGYGSSPGYGSVGSRHSVAAPPIPAKIPLDGNIPSEDMTALSMELSTIDIGPGSGGRARATTRRRFGGY